MERKSSLNAAEFVLWLFTQILYFQSFENITRQKSLNRDTILTNSTKSIWHE